MNNHSHFSSQISKKQASDSGMALVLIFLIISLVTKNDLYLKITIAIQVVNMIYPMFFYPFAILWLGLSRILGVVGSTIILTIVFYLLVTPIGLLRKLLRKHSLKLAEFRKSNKSVMIVRNYWFKAADLEKPY